MTALKAAEIDRFVARPDPGQPIVLVYGPDAGLVRERVDALVKASVDDVSDPFAFVRIEGDELSGNPARLVEEAHTVPLFGGRRAVLVRAGSRNIAGAVDIVIAAPSRECRIIIEAGDLKKSSPLRAANVRAVVGSVTSDDERRRRMMTASRFKLVPRGLKGFSPLAERSGFRLTRSEPAQLSDQVWLTPA